MPEFVLDTSDSVTLWDHKGPWPYRKYVRWEHLDAFTQGYIEAMFFTSDEELADERMAHNPSDDARLSLGFSDLAPETLARIIEDCDWLCTDASIRRTSRDLGREIWAERQAGNVAHLVPLTAYLGDDGKVYLS